MTYNIKIKTVKYHIKISVRYDSRIKTVKYDIKIRTVKYHLV